MKDVSKLIINSTLKAWRARYPDAIICHQYRLIYFPVPKAASSSVKTMLARLEGNYSGGNPHHDVKLESTRGKAFMEYEDYLRFTVVRNPWDRLVSCYTDKVAGFSTDKNFSDRQNIHFGFERYNKIIGCKLFFTGMSFADFIGVVVRIPDVISDKHFRSQYRIFSSPHGRPLTTNVLKFEELPASLNRILEERGLPVLSDHANRTQRKNYRSYYDNALRERVARRYRHDIEILDYVF